jgi:hypothetical protein
VDRPQDGDEDGTAVCDIGAYELQPALPTPTPTPTGTPTAGPSALPPTGGWSGSSAGVPWLAVLVAGVALAGVGGALVAARRWP